MEGVCVSGRGVFSESHEPTTSLYGIQDDENSPTWGEIPWELHVILQFCREKCARMRHMRLFVRGFETGTLDIVAIIVAFSHSFRGIVPMPQNFSASY